MIAALITAIVAGEAIMWLMLPSGLDMRSQFRPGPYEVDPDIKAIVFGGPNYDGFLKLHNADIVHRLKFDQYGFRNITTTPLDGPYDNVFIVGGASQTFGHGLPAEQTWPANLAREACWPIRVYNGVTPGDLPALNYFKYKKKMGSAFKPKIVVFANYGSIDPNYGLRLMENGIPSGFPDDFSAIGQGAIIIDGWPRAPTIANYPFWDRSRLFGRVAGRIKSTGAEISSFLEDRFLPYIRGWIGPTNAVQPNLTGQTTAIPGTAAVNPRKEFELKSVENYRFYLNYLKNDLEPFGAKVLILNLPISTNHPDPYIDLRFQTPPEFPLLDLQKKYFGMPISRNILPDSHYGPKLTNWIGRQVADELCRLRKAGWLD